MSEFKEILVDQTARVLGDYCSHDVVEAADEIWPAALWDALAEIGLPLALIDPEAGGAGADLDDASALIRLTGRFAAPAPIGDTMIANWLWAMAGGAAPSGPVALAAEGDLTFTPDDAGAGGRIAGVLPGAPWGDRASILALAKGPGRPRLVLIPPDADRTCVGRRNIAGDPRSDVALADLPLDGARLRPLPPGWRLSVLEEYGALIRSAQMAGAMDRALALAISHANTRTQFGRSLAKFQAVQQQLAVAVEHSASAASAVDAAIASAADPGGDLEFPVAVAKIIAGRAATSVAAIAHQVHGAIGFSREYELQHVTRRLWAWREEYGAELVWQRRIGRRLLSGGGGVWEFITSTGKGGAA